MTLRQAVMALIGAFAVGSNAGAQDPTPQPPAPNLPATINIYLDCNFCDFNFIREEIPYVNWVRDQAVADVHLLATSQGTGGGGAEYVFNFIGLRGFARTVDTLKYVASVDATEDVRRRGHVRTIKTGIVPFLARTGMASRLQISVAEPPAGGPASAEGPKADPWHGWVFDLSASSFMSGEKSYQGFNGWLEGGARRITETWKSVIGGEFSYDDQKTHIEATATQPEETFTRIQRNWSTYGSQFRAVNQHWSLGATASLGSNTYRNQQKYAQAKAAVEYNLFPYKESTRRQLRAQYGIGAAHYQYKEITIYDKAEETVPIHFAGVAGSARQPWGSLNGSLTHNALLLKPAFRSTRAYGNAEIRVMKGLRFYVSGQYQWIHDQLYLEKGDATDIDVLLRQRALKTAYSYWGNFGISYTFGSIFNNVVFPRFGSSNQF